LKATSPFIVSLSGNGSWNKKNNSGVLVKSTRGGRFELVFVNTFDDTISVAGVF
jgi:hypothetical protein